MRERLITGALTAVTILTIAPFIVIVADVAVKGCSSLTPELLCEFPRRLGIEGGAANAVVGSILVLLLALVFAIPLCLGGALFLSEFLQNRRIRSVIEFAVDVLAGVPSIVFGAFGYIFFAYYLGLGTCWLTASLTLALMMIPIMLRTAEEAMRRIPNELREAAFALGATRWQVATGVVMRAAMPAITSGILLAIARVIGETAPLLLTTGYSFLLPASLLEGVATMTVQIFMWVESPFPELVAKAYGLALLLLLVVVAIDIASNILSRRFARYVAAR